MVLSEIFFGMGFLKFIFNLLFLSYLPWLSPYGGSERVKIPEIFHDKFYFSLSELQLSWRS